MVSERLVESLQEQLPQDAVFLNEPMEAHTTFKIGGPADVLVRPESIEHIQMIVSACKQFNAPLHVIGRGSDLLIADAGLPGVVMELSDNFSQIKVDGSKIEAQAGASNADVAEAAAAAGLTGYEFACGIPGSIGGAAIMNAGAYDGEFDRVAEQVTCVTPESEIITVSREEADWGYRHSMMDDRDYVVVSALLQLESAEEHVIRARMEDLTQRRESKQPLEMPSAGSTFKRPQGYFAGKLIQDAGLRGYRIGGAQVSTKHTGFVVNAGGATAQDVRDLIRHVQQRVYDAEHVELQPEVRMWGFDD